MSASSRPLSLVLLDVGNVLIHVRSWNDILPLELLPEGFDPSAAIEAVRASDVLSRFERGQATAGEFSAEVRRRFSIRAGDEEIASWYRRILGDPVEGMESLLRELKSRGFRLAGLTNTSPIHLEALSAYPAVALLERLVSSCEIGWSKPSREAYGSALRLLDADPRSTLFVDDRQENVDGARAVGLRALLFEGPAELRQVLLGDAPEG